MAEVLPTKVEDVVVDGVSKLLHKFKGSPNLEKFLELYLSRIQEVHDVAYDLLLARGIDQATEDRLDGIGELLKVPRSGMSDFDYRIRLRAEIAINRSNGTLEELALIMQLLLGLPTKDTQMDEYSYPNSLYMRQRNQLIDEATAKVLHGLLSRAKPAGLQLHLIHALDADDTNLFTFDIGPGFDQGKLAGDV